ncbi:hypothetical protein [Allopontixanthobacter sediminis]|uniref:Uncharacterized protein n=1 Tax=Allopontixanthobacter sediminis TaxID=1689985 RepID=A0A845B1Y9_9SPHN|nr:hypothetical protein [Allopontixanthobacter sediminis]MXP44595.1 hypothetical protein [Allopontixanthobacter sediminis]
MRDIRSMPAQPRADSKEFDVGVAVSEALTIALMNVSSTIQVTNTACSGLIAIGVSIQIQQILINLIRNACEAV